MQALQQFVIRFLGPYLSYMSMPLVTAVSAEPQRDDVPDELIV
jgi:hypothetical protein